MKKLKKIGIIIMVGLLSLSFNGLQVFAMDEKPYQEYHGQLDLNRLELSVNDQKELIVSVDESLNFFDRIKGEREKRETEELFQQYPDMKDGVVESIRYYEPIQAIGYTVAPIVCIDNNHYERIRRENMFLEALISPFTLQAQAANSAGGKTVTKDYFTLQTAIARTSYNSTTKEYRYVATTNAVWTKNSILGGSKYPDGGKTMSYRLFLLL